MILFALGFVFGAWLLQQQAALPTLYAALALVPSLIFILNFHRFQFNIYIRKASVFAFAGLFGFMWAAGFATVRLSDALPKEWEQKNINVVGVIATLPELTEKGERFQFDVEKIQTQGAKIPRHISLNFYGASNTPSVVNHFHAARFKVGQRWQFSVKLKRPHSTYNPHGYDFEGWALENNIRATGSISNKSDYKKLNNFVWRPSYLVEKVRESVGNYITQSLVDKPYSGVIRALVVGDDSQISQAQWNVYLRTGVNHLMSIYYLLKHNF